MAHCTILPGRHFVVAGSTPACGAVGRPGVVQGLWASLHPGLAEPRLAWEGEQAAGSPNKRVSPLLLSLLDLRAFRGHFASSSGPLRTGAAQARAGCCGEVQTGPLPATGLRLRPRQG